MGHLEKIKNSNVLRAVACVPVFTAAVPMGLNQTVRATETCTVIAENRPKGDSSVSIGSVQASDPDVRRGAFGNAVAMAAAELGISESALMERAIRNLPKKLGVRKGGWAKEVVEVEKGL